MSSIFTGDQGSDPRTMSTQNPGGESGNPAGEILLETSERHETGAGGAGPGAICEVTTAEFESEVMRASMEQPILVDFWAPWCGPCQQLGPELEAAVAETRGAVRLVKVDIDKSPELAQALRIQSIPAVFAFHRGQPIDGFMGALPGSQLREFISRIMQMAGVEPGGPDLRELVEQGEAALGGGDADGACALFSQALESEPEHPPAVGGLVRALVARGDLREARDFLGELSGALRSTDPVGAAESALELAEQAQARGGGADELRARIETDPGDLQGWWDLHLALLAEGDREGAVDALFEILQRDRAWEEEAARTQLLKLFDSWGTQDPLTAQARRRLASLLFA